MTEKYFLQFPSYSFHFTISQYSKNLMSGETYSYSWQKQECSISFKMSRLVLGPIQPPSQAVLRALSLWARGPECQADHSPPPSDKVKNEWIPPPHHSLHEMPKNSYLFTAVEVTRFTWKNHCKKLQGFSHCHFCSPLHEAAYQPCYTC